MPTITIEYFKEGCPFPSCLNGVFALEAGERVRLTLEPKNPAWPEEIIADIVNVEPSREGFTYTISFDEALLNGGTVIEGCDFSDVQPYCCCDQLSDDLEVLDATVLDHEARIVALETAPEIVYDFSRVDDDLVVNIDDTDGNDVFDATLVDIFRDDNDVSMFTATLVNGVVTITHTANGVSTPVQIPLGLSGISTTTNPDNSVSINYVDGAGVTQLAGVIPAPTTVTTNTLPNGDTELVVNGVVVQTFPANTTVTTNVLPNGDTELIVNGVVIDTIPASSTITSVTNPDGSITHTHVADGVTTTWTTQPVDTFTSTNGTIVNSGASGSMLDLDINISGDADNALVQGTDDGLFVADTQQVFAGTLEPTNELPSSIAGWENVDNNLPAVYHNEDFNVTFYYKPTGTAGDLLDPLWDTEWVYKDTTVSIPTQLATTIEYNAWSKLRRLKAGVSLTVSFEAGTHTVTESIVPHPDWEQIVFTGVNSPNITFNNFVNSGFVDAVTDAVTSSSTIAADRVTNDTFLQGQYQTVVNCRVPFFISNIYGIRRQDMLFRAVDAADNLTITSLETTVVSQECVVLDQRVAISGGQFGVLVRDGGVYNGFDRVFVSGAASGVSNSSGGGFIRVTAAVSCSVAGASTNGAELIIDNVKGCFFGVSVTNADATILGEVTDCQVEGIVTTRSNLILRNVSVLRNGRHGIDASQCIIRAAGLVSSYNDNNGMNLQETKMLGIMGESKGNGGIQIFGNFNTEARLNATQTGTSPSPNVLGNNNTYFVQ